MELLERVGIANLKRFCHKSCRKREHRLKKVKHPSPGAQAASEGFVLFKN